MEFAAPYAGFAKKQMKIQFVINFILNGLFTWVAFQLSTTTLYVQAFGSDSMIQDLIITNFFLCGFVFFFGNLEAKGFIEKQRLPGHWVKNDSPELKLINKYKPAGMTMKKAIFKIFIKASLFSVVLAGVMLAITPEAGIPWHSYWAFKVAYACALAMFVARTAAIVGTANPHSAVS